MQSLANFGYFFDKDGSLKNMDGSGQGFVFDVYGSRAKNQDRYEQLGKIVNASIYEMLEEKVLLKKIYVPLNIDEEQPRGFIFASAGYEKEEKLVLLIHGSGVVRTGQWSRKLIINNSLNEGSQLPYIKKARELGYGVLVLNSNQNYDEVKMMPIPGSESPAKHMHYVWKNIVKPCSAKHIAIVAHSYGGVITVKEATKNKELRGKTFAIAFTDSVHGTLEKQNRDLSEWFQNTVCNWVCSDKELDTPLRSHDCQRMSAGTSIHERTSWRAFDSVWRFINEKLEKRLHSKPLASCKLKGYVNHLVSFTATTEAEVAKGSNLAMNKTKSNEFRTGENGAENANIHRNITGEVGKSKPEKKLINAETEVDVIHSSTKDIEQKSERKPDKTEIKNDFQHESTALNSASPYITDKYIAADMYIVNKFIVDKYIVAQEKKSGKTDECNGFKN